MSQDIDQPEPTDEALEDQLELEPSVPDEPEAEKPVADTEEAPAADPEEAPADPEAEPAKDPESEQAEPTEAQKPTEETPEERNRRGYEERQAQKREAEQALDQAYQPQPLDGLTKHFMEQGYDQFQAQMLAQNEIREQRDQLREVRTQVAELNMQVETEATQVLHEFPVFDPRSPEYDKDFADQAGELYAKAAHAQFDPKTGLIVRTSITPYNFYKQLADMRSGTATQQQVRAQVAAEKQMAAVAPSSSTAPVVTKSKDEKQADDLSNAFEQI